nr:MAG TPA: hypothetical protein [Caudoviricetes sp.]
MRHAGALACVSHYSKKATGNCVGYDIIYYICAVIIKDNN